MSLCISAPLSSGQPILSARIQSYIYIYILTRCVKSEITEAAPSIIGPALILITVMHSFMQRLGHNVLVKKSRWCSVHDDPGKSLYHADGQFCSCLASDMSLSYIGQSLHWGPALFLIWPRRNYMKINQFAVIILYVWQLEGKWPGAQRLWLVHVCLCLCRGHECTMFLVMRYFHFVKH